MQACASPLPHPCSAETLRALERHLEVFAPSYSGSALANLLNACAQSDALLGNEAVAAVEARAVEILSQQAAAARQRARWGEPPLAPPQGFTLGAVSWAAWLCRVWCEEGSLLIL